MSEQQKPMEWSIKLDPNEPGRGWIYPTNHELKDSCNGPVIEKSAYTALEKQLEESIEQHEYFADLHKEAHNIIIPDLEKQLAEARTKVEKLELNEHSITLHRENLIIERDEARAEIAALNGERDKVKDLETEIAELKKELEK
jgi:TolA-binding protein